MKKVIIISPAYPLRGGISESTELLYQEYLKKGIDCQIVSYKLQYPRFFFPGKTQIIKNSKKETFNIVSVLNSINPFSWYSVSRYINFQKPDYVIFRYWNPFFSLCLGFIALFLKNTKKVGWVDNVFPHKKIPFQKIFNYFFLKKMDSFVVMSQSVKKDLKKFNSKAPIMCALHPIYNNFGNRINQNIARNNINVTLDNKYLLFFGFIRKYKGLELLLESMSDQKIIDRNIKLIIAGEFYEDEKSCREKIKDLNLSNSVYVFDNYIDNKDVNNYFCACDLVVQPYLSATQSGISMIAFHFNKPVLATNVGGLSEYIKDGKNGYLVNPKSTEITNAIVDYFDHKRELDFVKQINNLKEKYSWSKLLDSFEKVVNIN